MTSEQFLYWLQGFVELSGHANPPTAAQWKSICEHLTICFTKVTPPLEVARDVVLLEDPSKDVVDQATSPIKESDARAARQILDEIRKGQEEDLKRKYEKIVKDQRFPPYTPPFPGFHPGSIPGVGPYWPILPQSPDGPWGPQLPGDGPHPGIYC